MRRNPDPADRRGHRARPISRARRAEGGNVIFFILLAVVLIGLVTAAIRSGTVGRADVDQETVTVDESKVRQYASELERATFLILSNGVSETDIRFAYADAPSGYGNITANPQAQVFSPSGGGAGYQPPPGGENDGSSWEFYGNVALPNVGSDKPELIAVLPHVTAAFCSKINQDDGYDPANPPAASGTCISGGPAARFSDSTQYSDTSPVTMNAATFTTGKPALDGCVTCDDGTHYYFHVLHPR